MKDNFYMLKSRKTNERQFSINERQFYPSMKNSVAIEEIQKKTDTSFTGNLMLRFSPHQCPLSRFVCSKFWGSFPSFFEIPVEITAIVVPYHFTYLFYRISGIFSKQTGCLAQTKFLAPRAEVHSVMVFHILPEE